MSLNCPSGDWVAIVNNAAAYWADGMWRACWQGTLLIALIWATCRLFPRMPASMRCWLWWLACLKLCAGLFWSTPIDVPLLPAPTTLATSLPTQQQKPTAQAPTVSSSQLSPAQSPGAQLTGLSPISLLMLAWLGTGVLWMGILARQLLTMRRLIAQAQPVHDAEVARYIALLRQRLGLHHRPAIVATHDIPSPLVVGPIHPVIVIPIDITQQLSSSELEMALTHEFMHVRRGDLWWAQIPALAQVLFFFHPLAWLAQREWVTSCEAACDADTLRLADASPAEYGRVLLKLVTSGRSPAVSITMGATRDYQMIESRIKGLLHYAPAAPSYRRRRAVLLLMLSSIAIVPWRVTARTADAAVVTVTNGSNATTDTQSPISIATKASFSAKPRVAVSRPSTTPLPTARTQIAAQEGFDGRIWSPSVVATSTLKTGSGPGQSAVPRSRNEGNLVSGRLVTLSATPVASPITRSGHAQPSDYVQPTIAPQPNRTVSQPKQPEATSAYVPEPLPTLESRYHEPLSTAPAGGDDTPGAEAKNPAYSAAYSDASQPQQSTYRNAYQASATPSGTYQTANTYRRPQQVTPPANNAPAANYPQQAYASYGKQIRQVEPQGPQQQRLDTGTTYSQVPQIPPQAYGHAPVEP